MPPSDVKQEIQELESVRRSATLWRWGTLAATLLIVAGGVALMNNAVQNLIRPGDTQERFVSAVNTNLQTNVVPELQTLATRTLTESQPIVQQEMTKLNDRVPEVADAAMKQFNLLQTELPEQSAEVMNETFGQVLAQRKAKIKEMFPDATDERIDTFITNLSRQGNKSLANVSVRLFDRHIEAMSALSDNVDQIAKADAGKVKEDIPTWQMGLLLFDIARADMGDLQLTAIDPDKPRVGSQSIDQKNQGIKGTGLEKAAPATENKAATPTNN